MGKKVCLNNKKTIISRKISLKRSIVYSTDDYNHASSQEASSELQCLDILHYLVFFILEYLPCDPHYRRQAY